MNSVAQIKRENVTGKQVIETFWSTRSGEIVGTVEYSFTIRYKTHWRPH